MELQGPSLPENAGGWTHTREKSLPIIFLIQIAVRQRLYCLRLLNFYFSVN